MSEQEKPDKPEKQIKAFVCSEPKCSEGEHVWDGPIVQIGNAHSISCSKCGISAFEVSTFMGGW